MPRLSAFSIAQADIEEFFDRLNNKVWSIRDLEEIFEENKKFWRLPESWDANNFINALKEKSNKLKAVSIEFPNHTFNRFLWKEVSPIQLSLSISKKSYISHYSAVHFHGLTDQIPKTIYITVEQSLKQNIGSLTQEAIDQAFSKPQRISKNKACLSEGQYICLLYSKYTNNIGVVKLENSFRITNLERTLIDATVRPLYAGGVFEVLEAYKRAADKVSINKLVAILKKINYIYPYHQAIGFYLERSGAYKENQISMLKKFDNKFDFYLTYNMKEKEYSKEWQLYYPKGF